MLKRSRTALVVLAAMGAVALATQDEAAELPARLKVGEQMFVRNGSGTRYKNLLPLYAAGLYLPKKSNQAASIVAADAPMAIRIEITSIFVSQENLVEALNEGLKNSTQGNTAPIRKEIEAFRGCFKDKIKRGDVFDLVYVPASGVLVAKNGEQQGVIAGMPFKQALFGVWLSDRPADEDLKKGLLGD